MGNLESAEGGPGEPPSVSLLPPPGKMPMPEPCELEERFALVLVRAEPSPFPPPTIPEFPVPGVRLCSGAPIRPPYFREASDRLSAFLATSEQPLAARQPRRGLADHGLSRWTLRRRGPQPGTSPGSTLLPPFSPFCSPRTSPYFPASLPGALEFLNLLLVPGDSETWGRPTPQPKSGFSGWGDRLSS